MDAQSSLAIAQRHIDDAVDALAVASPHSWQSDLAATFAAQLASARARTQRCADLVAQARAAAYLSDAPRCLDVR